MVVKQYFGVLQNDITIHIGFYNSHVILFAIITQGKIQMNNYYYYYCMHAYGMVVHSNAVRAYTT